MLGSFFSFSAANDATTANPTTPTPIADATDCAENTPEYQNPVQWRKAVNTPTKSADTVEPREDSDSDDDTVPYSDDDVTRFDIRRELFPSDRKIVHWLRNHVCTYYTQNKEVFAYAVKLFDTQNKIPRTYEGALACFRIAYLAIDGEFEIRKLIAEEYNDIMCGEVSDYNTYAKIYDNVRGTLSISNVRDTLSPIVVKTLWRYLVTLPYPVNIRDFSKCVESLYKNSHSEDTYGVKDIVSDIVRLESFLPANTRAFYTKQRWWEVTCEVQDNDGNWDSSVVKTFKSRKLADAFKEGCESCAELADADYGYNVLTRERVKTYVYKVFYDEEPTTPTTPTTPVFKDTPSDNMTVKIAQCIWSRDEKQRNWTNKIKRSHVETALGRIEKDNCVSIRCSTVPLRRDLEKAYIVGK